MHLLRKLLREDECDLSKLRRRIGAAASCWENQYLIRKVRTKREIRRESNPADFCVAALSGLWRTTQSSRSASSAARAKDLIRSRNCFDWPLNRPSGVDA